MRPSRCDTAGSTVSGFAYDETGCTLAPMQKRIPAGVKGLQELARLFRPVRDEVISLLASRYIFRTVQEIRSSEREA